MKSDGLRLIGYNGLRRSLDHNNIKIEHDGCQLTSLDVSLILYIISYHSIAYDVCVNDNIIYCTMLIITLSYL